MRRMTRSLLIAIAALSLGWSILSLVYTKTVSDDLRELRREKTGDIIHLRARIRELEAALATDRPGSQMPPSVSTDTPPSDIPADSDVEEITLPTHQSPETQPPADVEADAPAALYYLAAHDGILGVFDGAGELLHTVNVYVMTLPEADREALIRGIPAATWTELCELLDKYA